MRCARRIAQLALNLSLIFGATLVAAIIAGVYLGRSAARPVQRLAEGAQRVAAGDYSTHVDAAGGLELANLADAFNGMQTGIAQREARLLHVARHDDATGLPNRRHAEEWLATRSRRDARSRDRGHHARHHQPAGTVGRARLRNRG